jgi:hypothetical protein
MKRKEGWCFKRLVIFAAAAVLMVSFVALTASVGETEKPELTSSFKKYVAPVGMPTGPRPAPKQTIIWDNGGTVVGGNVLSSQNDAVYPFVSQVADDFMFTEDMDVMDVHWWGGFWGGDPFDPCDFYIHIYADDGTGNAPTGAGMADPSPTALASYHFTAVSGLPLDPNGFYEYDVDLSPPFTAAAGVKYWIAIQSDFAYPPQWGWTVTSGIQLHQGVQGFPFLGMPFWTDLDPAVDMAFYLTGEPAGPPWPNHKMHFPQLPDLIGWDVNAVFPKTLADDWQCSQTGPVEDIHFWGSWKNIDGMPNTDDFYTPMPWFGLSIHRNIPASVDTPWSRPGEMLWWWDGEILGVASDPPTFESWYDPNTDSTVCNDHMAYWRYDFYFDQAQPPPEPFIQYKDSIYWLNIAVEPSSSPPPYHWGWKTSRDHFMDDAVYTDNPPEGPWYPMIEPPRCNWFDVYFDATGTPEDWESSNYYGTGWYEYEYWWNMWFYDNPFSYDRVKEVFIDRLWVAVYGPQPYAEFALNWSTPEWDALEMGRPPLPSDGNEELYIGREIVGPLPLETLLDFTFAIPYNPEWISIDFVAMDVVINGWIYHECVETSMDMAFVITGPECVPSIDAEKKVWDEENQDWVDSIDMDVCNNADFLITVHNDGTCCDLTDIVVEDFMDASLEYVSAEPPPDYVDPIPEGTLLGWSFPGPLEPCNTLSIRVTAHVVGPPCHLDSNYIFVHGACVEQAVEVYDEDVAYVHATEPPPSHKMHYPQMPNPEGWDVIATEPIVLADDFMCTESGRITGIRLWGSWWMNLEGPLEGFLLSIHENIPGPPYSRPGELLWEALIMDFEMTPEGQGLQGWYDPAMPFWEYPDHDMYFRYDINDIPEPFCQDSGTIYWLNVMAIGPMMWPEPPLWGWKTSLQHFEDDAVWAFYTPPVYDWIPLTDPITGMTLDMSFVITGEDVLCGDVNHSGAVEAGDVVYLISYLYKNGPPPCPLSQGDVNCNGTVDAGDVVYLIGIPDC